MSKKLFYIKVVIVSLFIIIVCMFILVLKNIQQSSKIKETVVEETIKEEKIVFNMKLPPNKQKNLKGHVKEYMSQVYDYLYKDVKWKNIKNPYPYSYSELKEKKDLNNFYNVLKMTTLPRLVNILFDFNNVKRFDDVYIDYPLNMDDLPVTENYKKKHPKPLYEEFEFITKKVDNNIYYTKHDMNILCKFFYNYGIGLNEEEKIVTVYETKSIETYRNFDGEIENTVVYDKKGNEITEDSADTREFVFKYTLDEKGYVDDIEYVKVNELDGDKYLNEIWQIVKS